MEVDKIRTKESSNNAERGKQVHMGVVLMLVMNVKDSMPLWLQGHCQSTAVLTTSSCTPLDRNASTAMKLG